VEQVELVLGIVDEVDSRSAGHHGEAEERARAIRPDGRRRCLRAARSRLDDISVASVHGEDVAVGCESKSKRHV
jgi:hypothetical protein